MQINGKYFNSSSATNLKYYLLNICRKYILVGLCNGLCSIELNYKYQPEKLEQGSKLREPSLQH